MIVFIQNGEYIANETMTEAEFYESNLYKTKGCVLYHPPNEWPIPAPPPTQSEILASLTAALEAEYDAVAQAERYDTRYTCALRAGYPGPFQQQGITFATWMDNCNAAGYQIMADVLAGNRPIPTVDELITEIFAEYPKPW